METLFSKGPLIGKNMVGIITRNWINYQFLSTYYVYLNSQASYPLEHSGSVVECLTRDQGVAGFVCNCSMFCCTLLYVHSSIAIILVGKRELVALLNLSSWCLMMVERLFLAVPWVVCGL